MNLFNLTIYILLNTRTIEGMSSNDFNSPYSYSPPYSPPDGNSNVSRSPWSASSQTGSGFDSLTLPPLNPDSNFTDLPSFNPSQYFDALPRLSSPDPFLPDPATARQREDQQSPSNQQARRHSPQLSQYRVNQSESPDPFENFVDYTSEPEAQSPSQMPSRSHNTTRSSSVVDLTESSPMAPNRKRKAEDQGEGRATKVSRASGSASRSSRSTPTSQLKYENADIVDLVNVEDEAQYADFRAKQQAEAIKQQAQEEANRPIKLAEFQCIICMDNPTDLTVTHCGMFF